MRGLFIILLCSFSAFALSQTNPIVGLNLGVGVSTLGSLHKSNDNKQIKTGCIAGVSFDWIRPKRMSFSVALNYHQKGEGIEGYFLDFSGTNASLFNKKRIGNKGYNYIGVPIKIGVSSDRIGKNRPFVNFGGVPSYLLNVTQFLSEDRFLQEKGRTILNISKSTPRLDLCALVEVGVRNIKNDIYRYGITLGYLHGFNKVEKGTDEFNRSLVLSFIWYLKSVDK